MFRKLGPRVVCNQNKHMAVLPVSMGKYVQNGQFEMPVAHIPHWVTSIAKRGHPWLPSWVIHVSVDVTHILV